MIKPTDKVFHLGLTKADLAGAKLAIIPGAPERVEKIAQQMEQPTFLAKHREFTSYRAELAGQSVIVCSTGIGGPSTSIAVEELAQLGVTTFLRIGTTGAIQPTIKVGELIVTQGAVRLDGASSHFAPLCYPAVADFSCTQALVAAASEVGMNARVGITASSDTFYPGQERYDTYSGYVVDSFKGSLAQWQQLGVMNYEMESATLFTMCSALGLRAGMIAGVIVNRTEQEIPDEAKQQHTETIAIKAVVAAAERLLS